MANELPYASTEDRIATAQALITEEIAKHPRDLVLTNSFQAEDMVVLHIARQLVPDLPVVFLETGYHFAEVYEYRDRMAREWKLNLINVLPEITVAEQESQFGILNQTDASIPRRPVLFGTTLLAESISEGN